MSIHRRVTAKQTSIKIAGDFTIYEAQEARAQLLNNERGLDKNVILNLGQLEELDCAGVQLLLMLNKQVGRLGGNLKVNSLSDSARQVIITLNLSAPFSLQELPS